MLRAYPHEEKGIYHVVVLNFISLNLREDEWEPALKNAAELLKPGGWMQWIEPGITPLSSRTPSVLRIYKDIPDVWFHAGGDLLQANLLYQHSTKKYFGECQRLRPNLNNLWFGKFYEEKYNTKDNKELRKPGSNYLVRVAETRMMGLKWGKGAGLSGMRNK
jgi:hypothetical protein